jgi:hypothetical protein
VLPVISCVHRHIAASGAAAAAASSRRHPPHKPQASSPAAHPGASSVTPPAAAASAAVSSTAPPAVGGNTLAAVGAAADASSLLASQGATRELGGGQPQTMHAAAAAAAAAGEQHLVGPLPEPPQEVLPGLEDCRLSLHMPGLLDITREFACKHTLPDPSPSPLDQHDSCCYQQSDCVFHGITFPSLLQVGRPCMFSASARQTHVCSLSSHCHAKFCHTATMLGVAVDHLHVPACAVYTAIRPLHAAHSCSLQAYLSLPMGPAGCLAKLALAGPPVPALVKTLVARSALISLQRRLAPPAEPSAGPPTAAAAAAAAAAAGGGAGSVHVPSTADLLQQLHQLGAPVAAGGCLLLEPTWQDFQLPAGYQPAAAAAERPVDTGVMLAHGMAAAAAPMPPPLDGLLGCLDNLTEPPVPVPAEQLDPVKVRSWWGGYLYAWLCASGCPAGQVLLLHAWLRQAGQQAHHVSAMVWLSVIAVRSPSTVMPNPPKRVCA